MVFRILLASGLILSIALLALAIVLSPPGLQALGNFLMIRDPLIPVDSVIAVSGDGAERTLTASALLQQGYAHWLILSGSRRGAAPGGATAMMLRMALRVGIPRDQILVDDQSLSTFDNARNSAQLMQVHGLRRAILVTSPYHTRRAAWIFRTEFSRHRLEIRVYAAEESFFEVRQWWMREQDRGLVVREYEKMLAFLLGIPVSKE